MGFGGERDSFVLRGVGAGDTSTTTVTFNESGTTTLTEATDVAFRINDIDDSTWRDQVTIRAFDADGIPVEVTLTGGANMALSDTDGVAGNDRATAIDGTGNVGQTSPAGSLLVEIAGPVATIEIDYDNLETVGQLVYVTEFDYVVPPEDDGTGNDDVIDGGDGADTIFGELGGDTITGGAGDDSIDGGVGDDDISGGDDNDTLDGGEGTDIVSGDAGDDTIVISAGADTIDGGTGADTYDAQNGTSIGGETITVVMDEDGNGTVAKTNDGTTDTITSIETIIADEAPGEADEITLTQAGVLVGEVSGIDDLAVGLFFPKDGSGPIAFGGAGEPTFSELLAGTGVAGLGPAGTYQITSGDESGTVGNIAFENFETINFDVVCFASGTQIMTDAGPRPVEDLAPGDQVVTRDRGLQTIRWVGDKVVAAQALSAKPQLRPIRINAGALGSGVPATDLVVSPQHRILLRSKIAVRMFDTDEILVAAKHLVGLAGVSVAEDLPQVRYHHIMCDQHEIITADGAWAETLHTGPEAVKALGPDAMREITAIFGALPQADAPLARITPKGRRVRQMMARHTKNARALYAS